MSHAFCCDRCRQFSSGKPYILELYREDEIFGNYELCEACRDAVLGFCQPPLSPAESEPSMPDPAKANQPSTVDLSNPMQKGGNSSES